MDFLRKVPEDGSDKIYIISCEWKEDNFSIFVINNDSAWTGKLRSSDPAVESFCHMLGKSVEDYFAELKKGLSSTDTEGQFCFLLEHESFIVKKKDLKTGIKVKFCSIPLQEYPTVEAYSNLLSTAIEKINQYANDKQHLLDEVSALKSDKEDLVKNLELLAEMKNSMENTLYGKFLEVLNAKKAQLVAEALVAEKELGFDQSVPAQSENVVGKNKSASSKRKRVIESTFGEQQSGEDHPSTTIDNNHYDSETEEDTEEEIALDTETNTDDEKEMVEEPADLSVSTTFSVQPSTSTKSSEHILPKRGKRGNFNCVDEGKEMCGGTQDPVKLSERVLPKRTKRRPASPPPSVQDYTNCDTVPISAATSKFSDNEEEIFENFEDPTAVPSTLSAADSTTKSSERVLPKRTKRRDERSNKDSLPSVIPNSSIRDTEFNTQTLLREFD